MHPPSTPASQVLSLTPSPDREITHYSQAGFFRKSIPPKRKWGGDYMESHTTSAPLKEKRGLGSWSPFNLYLKVNEHLLKVLIDLAVCCLDLSILSGLKAFLGFLKPISFLLRPMMMVASTPSP